MTQQEKILLNRLPKGTEQAVKANAAHTKKIENTVKKIFTKYGEDIRELAGS